MQLMQKITAKTGGVFIDISDAAMLGDAMEDAANQYAADRTFLQHAILRA